MTELVDGRRPAHFCAHCGAPTRGSGARFCASCGASLGAHVDAAAVETPTVTVPAQPGAPEPEIAGFRFAEEPAPTTDGALGVPGPSRLGDRLRANRWLALTVAGALVAVAGGALWLVRDNGDPAVDEALRLGTVRYVAVLDAASAVTSVGDVRGLANRASAALPVVQRQQQAAERSRGDLAHAVAKSLQADAGTLTELAALAPLADDVYQWGTVQPDLAQAATGTQTAVKSLGAVDADAAATQPDTAGAVGALSAVLDDAAVEAAAGDAATVLTAASSAHRTTQVASLGDRAAPLQRRIGVVLPALQNGSGELKAVNAIQQVLAQTAGLSSLTRDDLGAWRQERTHLGDALTALPANPPALSSVAAEGTRALSHIDGIVSKADAAMRDWAARNASAIRAREQRIKALGEYEGAVRAQLRTYNTLRGDAQDFVDRVEAPGVLVTYNEAYTFFDGARWDRIAVRDSLNGLSVPDGLEGAHGALVAVVDRAVSATQAAYDGLSDAQWCATTCYYKDTPGWQQFSSESHEITQQFSSADAAWESAVEQAKVEADNTPLPSKPNV